MRLSIPPMPRNLSLNRFMWEQQSVLALTTAIPRSPAFLYLPWRLCNEYKMPLLDLCSTLTSGRTLLQHCSSCTGCPSRLQVPHHLQDRDIDAPHSTRLMSVVSHRPGYIQHGKLSTTSTQVVTNQSCSRETDTDAIFQTRLLSLWSQYMEQSSSSSPHHW